MDWEVVQNVSFDPQAADELKSYSDSFSFSWYLIFFIAILVFGMFAYTVVKNKKDDKNSGDKKDK